MPKISSYTTVKPVAGDLVIGTNVAGTPTDVTKNFLVEDIAAVASGLEQVLGAGNTATNNINLTGTITASGAVNSSQLTVASNATFGTIGGVNTFQTAANFNGGANITAGQDLFIDGGLKDGVASSGTSGAILSSTGTEVRWIANNWQSTSNTMTKYADDAAAGVGGLVAGDMYVTDGTGAAPLNIAGILMVKQ
jgi:hypothetical protein